MDVSESGAREAGRDGCCAPSVSVIVVNRDRAELLKRCIRSLLGQTLRPLEILVVDNGSSDDSIAVCEGFRDPRIEVLPQTANLGFAAANNLAFRRARGEFVALLNNDAEAEPEWLTHLTAPLLLDPRVGMCASKILLEATGEIDKVGHLIFLDGQNRGRGTGERDDGQFDFPEEALFPDGCAALYRARVVRETGGFDEDFFAYAEDADLGLRAQWLGWRCAYVPDAVVNHRHSSTLGPFSLQKIYWVERNRLWVAVKTFPLPLLLLNPLFTAYRWFWNSLAALLGRGPGGQAARETSPARVLTTVLKANWAALCRLPEMLHKRWRIRRERRLSDLAMLRLLWRFRISGRLISFGVSAQSTRKAFPPAP